LTPERRDPPSSNNSSRQKQWKAPMPRPKTIVITGATSGLGRLAAVELAKRGAHLVITARSEAKADATRALIDEAAPGTAVDVFLADLSRMGDVKRVGAQIADRYERIDVLINNAGLHAFEQRVTADGYPEMVAVNYLAPWLLTTTLLRRLIDSSPSRVVNVASEASRRHGTLTLPDDLTDTTRFTARGSSPIYGKTKLLNIMFSQELARRVAGTRVAVSSLDPGFNVTGIGRELGFAAYLERILNFLHIGDPARGAGIIVRLATDPAFEEVSGGYYSVKDAAPLTPTPPGDDPAAQRRLWEATEALLTPTINRRA
jgi:NAD(P)-dependent dehydrogenase (short-subunit alcohol dehydrogenase family)